MTTLSLFAKKRAGGLPQDAILNTMLGQLQAQINRSGIGFANVSQARSALSLEGLTDVAEQELQSSVTKLHSALEGIATELQPMLRATAKKDGTERKLFTKAQMQAATAAGIVAGDVQGFLRQPVVHHIAQEGMELITPRGGDFMDQRMRVALEAYDERDNKSIVAYSVAYNMQAARQDEFGETFYPTVVVTHDQVGFAISIRLIQVMNELRRGITGDLDNFGKRNILHAVIDPTILRNDQTNIVPIVRDESLSHFVAADDVAPVVTTIDGVPITTAPLAVAVKHSLLGISQTDALLETGLQDSTDSIDPAVKLDNLYIKIVGGGGAKEVLRFNVSRLPGAVFTVAPQGNARQMNLQFSSQTLLVNKSSKKVDGAALSLLASVVSGEYSVRLGVDVSGSVNLELGDTMLYTGQVSVEKILNSAGVELDRTTGAGKTIADLFIGASIIGYDLQAQRTNLNRRQRGQLIDTSYFSQSYNVPLRSPITVPRPMTLGDANDSSDLAALITTTHIRTSNAAVEELLKVADVLEGYVNNLDSLQDNPAILGVSRYLIKPFFEKANLNVATMINSLTSHERAADIQAVLVNRLRDIAYRMYRDSGYKAAADSLAGGISQAPTVIIGTDPVIARYLMVDGDFRTLGNEFNVKIVSTLDQRMRGKLVMTLGDTNPAAEGVPNPLHFGNMAWRPELTIVLPMIRNGAQSKELTVQPSFAHITNLPLMAVLNISGISDVVENKVAIAFDEV